MLLTIGTTSVPLNTSVGLDVKPEVVVSTSVEDKVIEHIEKVFPDDKKLM